MEYERMNVWYTAMLPHLDKPPSLNDFIGVERDAGSEADKCIRAWNKIDQALRGGR